jgi:MSHA biogenesis protein MshO
MNRRLIQQGTSLIEMVVAITVLGVLSAAAAIFLRGPIAGYFDTERRVDLADAGTLALAKLRLDIASAVPNSVRVATAGGRTYIELLPVRSQGRYRVGGTGNVLAFGVTDNGFDVLGPAVQAAAGDWVVVNNHLAGADVWSGSSRAAYTGAAGAVSTVLYAAHDFAADAPDHRFQIAGDPVSYVCDPLARTLTRVSRYGAPSAVQPTAFGAGAQSDRVASDLRFCRMAVVAGNLRRAQLTAFELGFERAGEYLNLAHTVRTGVLP